MTKQSTHDPEAATSKSGHYLSLTCERCGTQPASRQEREHIYEERFCYSCSNPPDADD